MIELVASEYTVGWSLVDEVREFLWEMKPDVLAKHLIGGLTVGEMDLDFGKLKEVSLGAAALDDPGYFVLPPVPNSLFTRDSSCWIFNGVSVNPMYWPARRQRIAQPAGDLPLPPDVPGRRLRVLVPGAGRRRQLQRPGLRPGVAGGRRRDAHRQRHGADRHERAHPGAHDRADRQEPVRQGRGRAGDRRRDDQGPGAHAPGHGLHLPRPRHRDRLSRRSSPRFAPSACGRARRPATSTSPSRRTSCLPWPTR